MRPPHAVEADPTPQAFAPASWLPGRHLQTIVPALLVRSPRTALRWQRWSTPDQDFIDVAWLDHGAEAHSPASRHAPLLVLFHGLEGSADSHYARATFHAARALGWRMAVPHFRSCGSAMNIAPRFYHSGDAVEIDWIMRRMSALAAGAPLFAAGVSLGGNALLRWLGEQAGNTYGVTAAAAVSAPLDLHAGGRALEHGFNRLYTRHFLRTLKAKSEHKLRQFPGLFDRQAMLAARTLHDFDNVVTAPLHGYRDADDYWHRASSRHVLGSIQVPTLVLNALNDPFMPASALPASAAAAPDVHFERPAAGGHVGFLAQRGLCAAGGSHWLGQRLTRFFVSLDNTHLPYQGPRHG